VCLRDLDEHFKIHVAELFERHPVDGETYPLEGHILDLEQLVRDTVLLELPLAPVCAGPAAADCRPEPAFAAGELDEPAVSDTEPRDPRWAALSELEL
jgi:uncharacterized protein